MFAKILNRQSSDLRSAPRSPSRQPAANQPLRITSYQSRHSANIEHIGRKLGGMSKLEGRKIVNLYHDSAYGRETISALNAQAKRHGFQITHIAVAHPCTRQEAQWAEVSAMQADWVILRSWGMMNECAFGEAAKVGFARDRIVDACEIAVLN